MPRFLDIARRGETLAAPELGHSVHVDVTGLEPDRWYYYRFIAGGEVSPIGRTRTFPPIGTPADRLRFAFASCQHYGQGYFTAYEAMMEDDLDLIVHLGDYIYESDWGPKVRFHLPEPISLEQYRNQHALYKSDRSLQAAHAWHPFAVTWDDHEVDNDYAAEHAEDHDAGRGLPDAAGGGLSGLLRAHAAAANGAADRPRHDACTPPSRFGDLASFMMLDNRQYRSDQACQGPERLRRAAGRGLRRARARGPLHARARSRSAGLRGQLSDTTGALEGDRPADADGAARAEAGRGRGWWSDGWDGYPAGRQRILSQIAEQQIENVVVIGGDIHSFWVTDLKHDFGDPTSPTVATEFVGTSVTSEGVPYDVFNGFLPENPHIRFFESRERGYVLVDVSPELWRTDLRVVDTITQPEATVRTLGSYAVEQGRAGAQPA